MSRATNLVTIVTEFVAAGTVMWGCSAIEDSGLKMGRVWAD
jgi:hypothetical protein